MVPLVAQDPEPDPAAVAEYRRLIEAGQEKALAQDWAAALPLLDRALELFPDDVVALRWRGHARTGSGRYAEAYQDLDRALRMDERDAWTQYARSMSLHHLGRYEDAVQGYTAALGLDPGFTKANQWRGFTRSLLGDHVAAIADIDIALVADPANAELYFIRGKAYVALGDLERAELDFWKVADLDQQHADSRAQLGYLYACQGLDDSARRLLREAIRIDAATQLEACAWLAQLELDRGDETAATEQLAAIRSAAVTDATGAWLADVAACMSRRLAPSALVAKARAATDLPEAERRGRLCEAWLHVGLTLRRLGDRDAALRALAHAVGTDARDKWEWRLAIRVLGGLGAETRDD